jgi:hypothetical protein
MAKRIIAYKNKISEQWLEKKESIQNKSESEDDLTQGKSEHLSDNETNEGGKAYNKDIAFKKWRSILLKSG